MIPAAREFPFIGSWLSASALEPGQGLTAWWNRAAIHCREAVQVLEHLAEGTAKFNTPSAEFQQPFDLISDHMNGMQAPVRQPEFATENLKSSENQGKGKIENFSTHLKKSTAAAVDRKTGLLYSAETGVRYKSAESTPASIESAYRIAVASLLRGSRPKNPEYLNGSTERKRPTKAGPKDAWQNISESTKVPIRNWERRVRHTLERMSLSNSKGKSFELLKRDSVLPARLIQSTPEVIGYFRTWISFQQNRHEGAKSMSPFQVGSDSNSLPAHRDPSIANLSTAKSGIDREVDYLSLGDPKKFPGPAGQAGQSDRLVTSKPSNALNASYASNPLVPSNPINIEPRSSGLLPEQRNGTSKFTGRFGGTPASSPKQTDSDELEWMHEEDDLAAKLHRLLRRQARRRGLDLS